MTATDHEVEDLLRRTFAAHDDVDPTRAEQLMTAAAEHGSPPDTAPAPDRRRVRAVLIGAVAASILVVGVVVAVVLGARHDDRPTVSRPPAPTVTNGQLSSRDADALFTRLSQSVKDAGTFSMHMSYDVSAILPRSAAATTPSPLPVVVVEMDERGDAPRMRASLMTDGVVQTHQVAIGSTVWDSGPPAMNGTVRWTEHHTGEEAPGLGDMFWPVGGVTPRAAWAQGVEEVNGVRAAKYLVVKDSRLPAGSTPSQDTPFSDGPVSRYEVWIDPATGRLVKASGLDEDGLLTVERIEYGGAVDPIEPPPADLIDQVDGPTGTAAP